METLKNNEPVVLAFIVAAVPVVCAFTLQVLDSTGALDNADWLRVLLTGLGPLVGTLSALWARAQVESPATRAANALAVFEEPPPPEPTEPVA